MAILANPIANLDADGRLVRLHCGTPGENCQLDQAKDKKTMTWFVALDLYSKEYFRQRKGLDSFEDLPSLTCHYCFGGEGDD